MSNATLEKETATAEPVEQAERTYTVVPAVDIIERPDQVIVLADLPGAEENSVEVQLENEQLTIGARASLQPPSGMEALYHGFDACEYRRVFALTDKIDREHISAALKHGVLRVTLPKLSAKQTRRTQIKIEKE